MKELLIKKKIRVPDEVHKAERIMGDLNIFRYLRTLYLLGLKMALLYRIGICIYELLLRFFSLFNKKAALFIGGRKDIFTLIRKQIDHEYPHIWFHFASLGEFEQGRPVLEKLKSDHAESRVIITFFSPSGFEIRKNYPLAHAVFYLPLDTKTNARKFLDIVKPELAVFTKYEFWYFYFKELHARSIPLIVISAIFRPDQAYFKWYGFFNRKILKYVTHFFVQTTESQQLLKQLHIMNVTISGDTRFDRVFEHAKNARKLKNVEAFIEGFPVLIAGSTWPADERLLARLHAAFPSWKLILAPHEIGDEHLKSIRSLFPDSIFYSTLQHGDTETNVLIIDNIGLLSSLYQYGKVAYIGGGFGAGIHNILEPAAFGLPLIFGPKYHKFQEAEDLIELGEAMSITDEESLIACFRETVANAHAGALAKSYVNSKTGATDQIILFLNEVLSAGQDPKALQ